MTAKTDGWTDRCTDGRGEGSERWDNPLLHIPRYSMLTLHLSTSELSSCQAGMMTSQRPNSFNPTHKQKTLQNLENRTCLTCQSVVTRKPCLSSKFKSCSTGDPQFLITDKGQIGTKGTSASLFRRVQRVRNNGSSRVPLVFVCGSGSHSSTTVLMFTSPPL